jgi:opacity protein-like surface antigen
MKEIRFDREKTQLPEQAYQGPGGDRVHVGQAPQRRSTGPAALKRTRTERQQMQPAKRRAHALRELERWNKGLGRDCEGAALFGGRIEGSTRNRRLRSNKAQQPKLTFGRTNPKVHSSRTLTDQSSIQSLASATARVGYAWDRFLLYARAGGAWERDNYSIVVTANGAPFGTTSEQRTGSTVGLGGEYAFLDFLTGFVEYDFYGFGTTTNTFNCTLAGCVSVVLPVDIKEHKNVFKVGLNFKFGPTAPEVARY